MATASMTQALPAPVVESIQALAQRCGIKRVRLFGSRARGDNRERSDLDKPVNPELLKSINRDGIDIYVGE